LTPLPAGDIVAIHNARLLSAKDADLYYSKPYDFGLCDQMANRITLPDNITIVAPCEGGVFIWHDGQDVFLRWQRHCRVSGL
jgi:hypothetical protein